MILVEIDRDELLARMLYLIKNEWGYDAESALHWLMDESKWTNDWLGVEDDDENPVEPFREFLRQQVIK